MFVAPGTTSSTVTWTTPIATDNDGVKSLVSNNQSPAVFPLGSHSIFYVATDNSGNVRQCAFTVTVTGMLLCRMV